MLFITWSNFISPSSQSKAYVLPGRCLAEEWGVIPLLAPGSLQLCRGQCHTPVTPSLCCRHPTNQRLGHCSGHQFCMTLGMQHLSGERLNVSPSLYGAIKSLDSRLCMEMINWPFQAHNEGEDLLWERRGWESWLNYQQQPLSKHRADGRI